MRTSISYKLVACGFAASAIIITAAGCTSVQWRGFDGSDNHFGLLTYLLAKNYRGTELRVTSIGVDLRLSGHDRGASIGLKRVTEIKPEVVEIRDPRDFGKQVGLAHSAFGKSAGRRGFLYVNENITRDATVLDTSVCGVDVSVPASTPSVTIGYDHSFNYVGDVLRQDIAQVQILEIRDNDTHLSLIKLHP